MAHPRHGSHSEGSHTDEIGPIGPAHRRKVVQVAVVDTGNGGLIALCDDGSLWELSYLTMKWSPVDISGLEVPTPPHVAPATAGAVGAAYPAT